MLYVFSLAHPIIARTLNGFDLALPCRIAPVARKD